MRAAFITANMAVAFARWPTAHCRLLIFALWSVRVRLRAQPREGSETSVLSGQQGEVQFTLSASSASFIWAELLTSAALEGRRAHVPHLLLFGWAGVPCTGPSASWQAHRLDLREQENLMAFCSTSWSHR